MLSSKNFIRSFDQRINGDDWLFHDELVDTPVDDELVGTLVDDELVGTLVDGGLAGTLVDDALVDTLVDDLIDAQIDELLDTQVDELLGTLVDELADALVDELADTLVDELADEQAGALCLYTGSPRGDDFGCYDACLKSLKQWASNLIQVKLLYCKLEPNQHGDELQEITESWVKLHVRSVQYVL